MDGLREMAAGGGWESSDVDGNGRVTPGSPVRPFSIPEETIAGGEGQGQGNDGPQEDGDDDNVRDVWGIDEDEEDTEDFNRLVEAVTYAIGEEEDGEEGKEEEQDDRAVSDKEKEACAVIVEMTINRLPSGEKAVKLVVQHLREHWISQQGYLKKLSSGMLGVKAARSAILAWWEFLVELLKANAKQPHDSTRAIAYEKRRREKRFQKQREFSHESTIVTEAIKLGVDKRRVTHSLISLFGAIDEVVDKTLAQELAAAHVIQVAYPTHDVELDVHQRRLVYNLAGWLLRTAISRVEMRPSDGSEFLPFVNSHKYGSADEFWEAHPLSAGSEFVVEERNIQNKGKGLIFPSADFYLFVHALEVGYRHAMLSPTLLGTYLGDLPADLKRVVSTAGPVKAAWARCVGLVKDPLLGEAGREGCIKQCDHLFDFLVMKWHRCRFFAFAKELTSLKNLKKAEMTLRDESKADAGGLRVGTEKKKEAKEPVVYTPEQRDYQRSLNRQIGSQAWRTLTIEQLREFIEKCGGKWKSGMRKLDLQRQLRSFAPLAGKDYDPDLAALRPGVLVPDNWRG